MISELQDLDIKQRMMTMTTAMASALPLPAAGVVSSAALIAGCMIGAGEGRGREGGREGGCTWCMIAVGEEEGRMGGREGGRFRSNT